MFFFTRPRMRVLFVCTANVCRSPVAEVLLRHYLGQQGLTKQVQVLSAGTRVAAPGRRPDPRMEKLARRDGLSLARLRARPLRPALAGKVDLIFAMDREHLQDVTTLMAQQPLTSRARLLGEYLAAEGEGPEEILDPYFGDAHCFEIVYEQIDRAVARLSRALQQQLAAPAGGL